uniref:IQ motif containing C n=1 Tax=Oncorhynchus tshawytscha TaxID=74940 RepID=A0A8C8EGZ5_ONCTS
MRKEINCARSEFEDIVRDIDGEVNHLEWKGHIFAIPHFKDVSILRFQIKCYWMLHTFSPDRGSHPLEQPGEREGAPLMSDRLEPERDDPYSHGRASISRGSSSLAQDEPHTPEALQLHRNTLAMEMLWLQQAIASRKKYLSLKESLNIS